MNLSVLLPVLEKELAGVAFGEVVIKVQVREGKPWRAEVSRSQSIMLETQADSAGASRKPLSVKVDSHGRGRP